jgi:glutamate carboxypeptidase
MRRNPQTDRLAVLAQEIAQEIDVSLQPVPMRFGTDAGFAYHPKAPKPAVLEGLGIVGAGLHAPEEWADLRSIVPRLYLTVRLLEELGKSNAPF